MDNLEDYSPLLIPKTKHEYQQAVSRLEEIMVSSPEPGTKEYRLLETIALNISSYEKDNLPVPPPDPIDAIRFRMEQKNLKQRDLEPFIGSKGRVSEILNRKRPLTYEMAQNLYRGLSIPASVLLNSEPYREPAFDWTRFPITEIVKRGWIDVGLAELTKSPEPYLREFLKPLGMSLAPTILFRRSKTIRAKRSLEDYALLSWMGRVAQRADVEEMQVQYDSSMLNKESLVKLVQLSAMPDGPIQAVEYLKSRGIIVVIEKFLSGANLDAVLIHRFAKPPIIGLSLLRDRIDNFWFSLLHEIGHLLLHSTQDSYHFVDDFDVRYVEDPIENEADSFAREALLPTSIWKKSNAFRIPSPSAVKLLAKKQKINPAIVAGRARYEANNYQLLHQMVGQGEVRKQFANYKGGA